MARRLSGGFGWPTVELTGALPSLRIGVNVLWSLGVVPMVVGIIVNSWVSFARYTVHHAHTNTAADRAVCPTIPWYRYRAALRELRPLLEANGAIIEGTGTEPYVPIQLRGLPHPAGS